MDTQTDRGGGGGRWGRIGHEMRRRWPALAVWAVSFSLGMYSVARGGLIRKYLGGAALSMSRTWENWFYTAYDPHGFITVEKPPLALWVQAVSVRVFGLNQWALLIPSVLMAAGTAYLVARILQKMSDNFTSLLGGTLVATMPGVVALGRANMADIYVMYFTALASYLAVRAVLERDGNWRAFVPVGAALGAALMAKGLFSLFGSILVLVLVLKLRGWQRVRALGAMGGTWAVVGLSWAASIELIDPRRRPYVAHTQHNSAFEQLVGWGSIEGAARPVENTIEFGGRPGWGRIFEAGGDQAFWLVALVLVLGVYILLKTSNSLERTMVVGCLGWVGVFWLVYSHTQRVVHEYYVATVAVPMVIVAVLGVRFVAGRHSWMVAGLAGGGSIAIVAIYGQMGEDRLAGIAAVLSGVIGAVLMTFWVRNGKLVGSLVALLILSGGQILWGLAGSNTQSDPWNPVSRPGYVIEPQQDWMPEPFYEIIRSNRAGEKYLVGLPSYAYAEIMVYNGEDPLVAGGFAQAGQRALTTTKLEQLVQEGELRYMVSGDNHPYASEVEDWLVDNCKVVQVDGIMRLLDCKK